MKIDKKTIKELSDYLNEFNLTEIEYTEKDTKIKVSKNNFSINNQPSPISNDASLLGKKEVMNRYQNKINFFTSLYKNKKQVQWM